MPRVAPCRRAILAALALGPRTTAQIAFAMGLRRGAALRRLYAAQQAGLVYCAGHGPRGAVWVRAYGPLPAQPWGPFTAWPLPASAGA